MLRSFISQQTEATDRYNNTSPTNIFIRYLVAFMLFYVIDA